MTVVILAFMISISLTGIANAQAAQGYNPPAPATGNQNKPATSDSGSGVIGTLAGWAATPIMGTIWAVLYAVRSFLVVVLSFAADFLNYAFDQNLNSNPSDWGIVQLGWKIARDIINSFFILIILWIAFTIIFGVEKYGGKALFFRVVLVALAINFSLVAVTAVFGFTNALAGVFARQMPSKDVAGIIVNAVKVQSTVLGTDARPVEDAPKDKQTVASQLVGYDNSGWQKTLAASLGIESSNAADGTPKTSETNLAKPGEANPAGNLTNQESTTVFGRLLKNVINLTIANIFLLITIAAVLVAAITLLVRLLAMILLSIFAPIAIATHAMPSIPGMGVSKYWDKWKQNLLQWAFFAPGFYFLFYLSLFMLIQTDAAFGKSSQSVAYYLDPGRIIQVLVALALMIAAVKLAKQTGGAITAATLGAASKVGTFALGAATGGAAMGIGALARRSSGTIESGLRKVSEIPVLGKITAPATRRVSGYLEEQKQKVNKERAEVGNWSINNLAQEYNRSFNSARKAAIAQILAEKGKLSEIAGTGPEADAKIQRILKNANQFGNVGVDAILKSRPDLVTQQYVTGADSDEEAKRLVVQRMKRDDIAKISDEVFKDDATMKLLWQNLSADNVAQLARDKSSKMPEMMRVLQQNAGTMDLDSGTYNFLASTAAQGLGLSLPQNLTKPLSVEIKESRDRLEEITKERSRVENELRTLTSGIAGAENQSTDQLNQTLAQTASRVASLEQAKANLLAQINQTPNTDIGGMMRLQMQMQVTNEDLSSSQTAADNLRKLVTKRTEFTQKEEEMNRLNQEIRDRENQLNPPNQP